MATRGKISELFDIPAIQAQQKQAVALVDEFVSITTKVKPIKITLEGADKTRQVITGVNELGLATKEYQKIVDATAVTQARLNVSTSDAAKKLVELKLQQQQSNKVLSDAAKEAAGLVGAYDRLVKEYNEAAKAAKNLATQQGQGNLAAQQAAKHANDLGNKIKSIDASVGQFQKNVGNYGATFHSLGESIGETIKDFASAYIGLIGIQGVGNFLEKTIEEFTQAEAKISSLKSILQNLGKEEVFERLSEKAENLAKSFGTIKSEDLIQVFDKLVTYGKLTENQINDLTPVIINFAAKQRISLADATDTITKALEGNARGLRQYGINVKDATNETGGAADAMDRLKLIMTELKPRVEGAAEAFGETAAGGIKKAKIEVDELEKSIGGKLQPVMAGFLKAFLSGVNGLVDGIQHITASLFDLRITVGDFFKNLATTGNIGEAIGLTSAAKHARDSAKEVLEAQNLIIENSKKLAEGNAEKPVEELEKLLKSYKAISAASVEILKGAKEGSEDFHKKQLVALADLQNVYQLQKLIEQKKDKSILGFGNNDKKKDTGDDDEARKHAEEMAKYLIELDDKLAKAKREYREEELKEISAQAKEVFDDVQASLDKRLAAYDIYAQAQAAIINRNAESEIAQQQKILDRIAEIKKKDPNNLTDEEEKTRAQEALVTQTIINLRQKREDAINKLAIDNAKIRQGIITTAQATEVSKIQEAADKEIQAANKAKDNRIGLLNEQYKRGLIDDQEYNDRRAEIEYQSAVKILKINIKLAQDLLASNASAGLNTTKDLEKLSSLKISLSDLETKHLLDNNGKQIKSEEEKRAAYIATLEKIKDTADKVFDIIGSAIDASTTARKNALEDQSNQIDKNSQQEIDAVNASLLSEQDKAAKIAIINARAQAQKEQIALKEKQLNQQKAVADKAKAIFDIILGTAVAIAKAEKIQDKIAAGLFGAAQLAIAYATPIPKFKHGKSANNTYEGIAEVDDGGKPEAIIRSNGNVEIGGNKPRFTWVGKRDIVLPDARQYLTAMAHGAHERNIMATNYQPNTQSLDKLIERSMETHTEKIVSAIMNKRELNFHWNNGELRKSIKNGNEICHYINSNTQF